MAGRRGPKPISDAEKIKRGTDQPSRMRGITNVVNMPKPETPIAIKRPAALKGEAKKKWDEVIQIIHEAGKATPGYLDNILAYCLIAGKQVELMKKGELLPNVDRRELRTLAYDLGLMLNGNDPGPKGKTNKFSGIGKR